MPSQLQLKLSRHPWRIGDLRPGVVATHGENRFAEDGQRRGPLPRGGIQCRGAQAEASPHRQEPGHPMRGRSPTRSPRPEHVRPHTNTHMHSRARLGAQLAHEAHANAHTLAHQPPPINAASSAVAVNRLASGRGRGPAKPCHMRDTITFCVRPHHVNRRSCCQMDPAVMILRYRGQASTNDHYPFEHVRMISDIVRCGGTRSAPSVAKKPCKGKLHRNLHRRS